MKHYTIKPLDWEYHENINSYVTIHNGYGPSFAYDIIPRENIFVLSIIGKIRNIGEFATVDEAKSAGQAHWDSQLINVLAEAK